MRIVIHLDSRRHAACLVGDLGSVFEYYVVVTRGARDRGAVPARNVSGALRGIRGRVRDIEYVYRAVAVRYPKLIVRHIFYFYSVIGDYFHFLVGGQKEVARFVQQPIIEFVGFGVVNPVEIAETGGPLCIRISVFIGFPYRRTHNISAAAQIVLAVDDSGNHDIGVRLIVCVDIEIQTDRHRQLRRFDGVDGNGDLGIARVVRGRTVQSLDESSRARRIEFDVVPRSLLFLSEDEGRAQQSQ